jgi:hypothetical protein
LYRYSEKEKMWLCMPVPFAPKPSPEVGLCRLNQVDP